VLSRSSHDRNQHRRGCVGEPRSVCILTRAAGNADRKFLFSVPVGCKQQHVVNELMPPSLK